MITKFIQNTCRVSMLAGLLSIPFLSGCATSGVNAKADDPEVLRLESVARDAYEQGAIETAADLYKSALERSRAIGDSRHIANSAYNYAACLAILGRHNDTDSLLEEARLEFRRNGESVADVLLLEAKVARLQGDRARTQNLLGALVVEMGEDATPEQHAQVSLLRADLACDDLQAGTAAKQLEKAMKHASRVTNPSLEAETARIQGRIFLVKSKPSQAAPEFDREAELLQQAGRYREMALAAGRSAMAYRDSGEDKLAADRFFVAARSLFAQGDVVAALRMIEPAVSSAERAGDMEAFQQTMKLFERIKKSVEASKQG